MNLTHDTDEASQNGAIALSSLKSWLTKLAHLFKSGERPNKVLGPFGTHGVEYHDEDEGDGYGPYVVVGFNLPSQDSAWFAEIEDGTYGRLQGFRLYYEDLENLV